MARPPKNIEVQDVNDESINQEAVAGAMVAMRSQAITQREQEDVQLAQAAQAVGGALMARLCPDAHAARILIGSLDNGVTLGVASKYPNLRAFQTGEHQRIMR